MPLPGPSRPQVSMIGSGDVNAGRPVRLGIAPCGTTTTREASRSCAANSRERATAECTMISTDRRAMRSMISRCAGVGDRSAVCSTVNSGARQASAKRTTSTPSGPGKMPNSCCRSTTSKCEAVRAQRSGPAGSSTGQTSTTTSGSSGAGVSDTSPGVTTRTTRQSNPASSRPDRRFAVYVAMPHSVGGYVPISTNESGFARPL